MAWIRTSVEDASSGSEDSGPCCGTVCNRLIDTPIETSGAGRRDGSAGDGERSYSVCNELPPRTHR